ncbi:hypothetical protein JGU66_07400 [Myxococcaceae bacterium JPH2]|nr:hypothetical protein [Myxococcaceae bacterium JPH2]
MSLTLQVLHREEFESRTFRALAGAGAMGVLAAIALRVRVHVEPGFFAVAAAALAGARPSAGYALALRSALLVLPIVPLLLELPEPLPLGLAAAITSALVAWLGHGREGVGTPLQVGASALAALVTAPLGLYVRQVLEARFLSGTGVLSTLVGFSVMGLFWSVGTLPANLALHVDPVAARGSTLVGTLEGEVRELVERALGLYRQCLQVVKKLPASAGRGELQKVLGALAQEAFSLAESHAALEAQLNAISQGDVDTQVRELRERASQTQDGLARRQLELAASSLGEELNRLDTLTRRRERMLAQLHAQVAQLERARVSFIGVQGSELGAKGEQAAQLARKLSAMGQEAAPEESTPVHQPPQGTRNVS